jgi:hypothetical protein
LRYLLGLIFLCTALNSSAQELLKGKLADNVNGFLDSADASMQPREKLDCKIEPERAFLDFSFRFIAGYTVACPMSIFGGKAAVVRIYVRITPAAQPSLVLAQEYNVPAPTGSLDAKFNLKKLRSFLEGSGAFFIAEGDYQVQLLAVDNLGRGTIRRWNLDVHRRRGESNVQLATLPSGPVCPLSIGWPVSEPASSRRSRITILVHTAPINPYARKIRAWDRALLLGSVSSVLQTLPAASVRLVAFNLDQQTEVFRSEHFTQRQMAELSSSIVKLELGTISVRKLNQTGGAELLATLANEERTADPVSTAVIFIGPWNRLDARFGKRRLKAEGPPQFYDIVFYAPFLVGREFPDAVEHLTQSENGAVEKVHSPAELSRSLRRIAARLDENDTAARTQ